MKRIGMILAAAALVAALGQTAFAQRHGCGVVVDGELSRLGLDRSSVGNMTLRGLYHNLLETNAPRGYLARMRPQSCKSGYLYMEFGAVCHLAQVYTRGDCRIKDVPHYW